MKSRTTRYIQIEKKTRRALSKAATPGVSRRPGANMVPVKKTKNAVKK
jgi:hypothetical protein